MGGPPIKVVAKSSLYWDNYDKIFGKKEYKHGAKDETVEEEKLETPVEPVKEDE